MEIDDVWHDGLEEAWEHDERVIDDVLRVILLSLSMRAAPLRENFAAASQSPSTLTVPPKGEGWHVSFYSGLRNKTMHPFFDLNRVLLRRMGGV